MHGASQQTIQYWIILCPGGKKIYLFTFCSIQNPAHCFFPILRHHTGGWRIYPRFQGQTPGIRISGGENGQHGFLPPCLV